MKAFLLCLLMALFAFSNVMCMSLGNTQEESGEAEDWLSYLSENRFDKRKFGPSDPRSLFKAVYSNYNGGYKKRYNTAPVLDEMYYAAPVYSNSKRGLRSPQDPRNLFRAVYGWK